MVRLANRPDFSEGGWRWIALGGKKGTAEEGTVAALEVLPTFCTKKKKKNEASFPSLWERAPQRRRKKGRKKGR